jgi:hypothetical protein
VHRKPIFILLLLLACGLFLPERYPPADASEHPSALMLYSEATGVRWARVGPTDQLTYHVRARFPASAVIGWISYQLSRKGWRALTRDYLDPGIPTSQVRGWAYSVDATNPKKRLSVHQWIGDWKDKSGDVVRYAFRYTYPYHGTPDLTHLHVIAIYVTAPVVKKQIEWAQKAEAERAK